MWENELISKLKKIRLRLRVLSFYRVFLTWLFFGALAALAFALVSRFVETDPVTLWHVLGGVGGAGVLFCLLWAAFYPIGLLQTAVHADVKLDLRERLSTAYVYLRDDREIVEEVKRDALTASRDIQPRRDFEPEPRHFTKFFWLPVVLALVMWQFVPQFDLFASRAPENQQTLDPQSKKNDMVVQELEKIQKKLDKAPVEKKNIGEKLDELDKDIDKLAKEMMQQPSTKPQKSMAKISNMQQRLEQERKELQKKIDSSKMTKPLLKTGETRKMAEALKKGDMEEARKALDKIMEKIESGEMTPEEMDRIAKQLEEMSEEVAENPEMSKKMSQLAQQMSKACKACQANGQLSKEDMQKLASMSDKLSQEMLSLEEAMCEMDKMAKMQKKLGECKSLCKGGKCDMSVFGDQYNRDKIGDGMKGPGIGRGNNAPFSESDVGFEDDKIDGQKGEGEIIASMKVPQMGEGNKGESRLKAQDITADYRREVETSMEKEMIPASQREIVRKYFEQLNPEN